MLVPALARPVIAASSRKVWYQGAYSFLSWLTASEVWAPSNVIVSSLT